MTNPLACRTKPTLRATEDCEAARSKSEAHVVRLATPDDTSGAHKAALKSHETAFGASQAGRAAAVKEWLYRSQKDDFESPELVGTLSQGKLRQVVGDLVEEVAQSSVAPEALARRLWQLVQVDGAKDGELVMLPATLIRAVSEARNAASISPRLSTFVSALAKQAIDAFNAKARAYSGKNISAGEVAALRPALMTVGPLILLAQKLAGPQSGERVTVSQALQLLAPGLRTLALDTTPTPTAAVVLRELLQAWPDRLSLVGEGSAFLKAKLAKKPLLDGTDVLVALSIIDADAQRNDERRARRPDAVAAFDWLARQNLDERARALLASLPRESQTSAEIVAAFLERPAQPLNKPPSSYEVRVSGTPRVAILASNGTDVLVAPQDRGLIDTHDVAQAARKNTEAAMQLVAAALGPRKMNTALYSSAVDVSGVGSHHESTFKQDHRISLRYSAGSSLDATEPAVLAHEHFHFMLDVFAASFHDARGPAYNAYHEGASDVFSALLHDAPNMALGHDGSFDRSVLNQTRLGDLGAEEHERSHAYAGLLYGAFDAMKAAGLAPNVAKVTLVRAMLEAPAALLAADFTDGQLFVSLRERLRESLTLSGARAGLIESVLKTVDQDATAREIRSAEAERSVADVKAQWASNARGWQARRIGDGAVHTMPFADSMVDQLRQLRDAGVKLDGRFSSLTKVAEYPMMNGDVRVNIAIGFGTVKGEEMWNLRFDKTGKLLESNVPLPASPAP